MEGERECPLPARGRVVAADNPRHPVEGQIRRRQHRLQPPQSIAELQGVGYLRRHHILDEHPAHPKGGQHTSRRPLQQRPLHLVGAHILARYHHRVSLFLAVHGARHVHRQVVGIQHLHRHQPGGGIQHRPVPGAVKDT